MSIADKLTEVAENVPKVYEAGKQEIISLHPEKTVSGSYISVDDVSELPHDVKCKVTGVDNPEGVTVTRCGANLLNPDNFSGGEFVEYNGVPCYKYLDNATNFTYEGNFKENTQYTISFKAYLEATGAEVKIYYTDGTSSLIYVKNNTEHLATSTANKTIARIKGTHGYAAGVYIDLSYSRINEGTTALPYEPYNGQTLTPSADGTVEGMTSVYPHMSIFTDNADAMLDVTYRISAGKQAEYDVFWDAFQKNGTRRGYTYGFYTWNVNAFRPKHDIVVESGNNMFESFNSGSGNPSIDLSAILEECGVTLDFSRCTTVKCPFYFSFISRVPTLDVRGISDLKEFFHSANRVITVDRLKLRDDGTQTFQTSSYYTCFYYCNALKNITFEGVIGTSIDFRHSPLSKASITNVIEHLSSTATGQTCTFKKTAKEAAFTADEWAALIANKTNWTFSLI